MAYDGAVHFEVRVIIHEVPSFKRVQGTAKEASKHKHTQQHGHILSPSFWACSQRS